MRYIKLTKIWSELKKLAFINIELLSIIELGWSCSNLKLWLYIYVWAGSMDTRNNATFDQKNPIKPLFADSQMSFNFVTETLKNIYVLHKFSGSDYLYETLK